MLRMLTRATGSCVIQMRLLAGWHSNHPQRESHQRSQPAAAGYGPFLLLQPPRRPQLHAGDLWFTKVHARSNADEAADITAADSGFMHGDSSGIKCGH